MLTKMPVLTCCISWKDQVSFLCLSWHRENPSGICTVAALIYLSKTWAPWLPGSPDLCEIYSQKPRKVTDMTLSKREWFLIGTHLWQSSPMHHKEGDGEWQIIWRNSEMHSELPTARPRSIHWKCLTSQCWAQKVNQDKGMSTFCSCLKRTCVTCRGTQEEIKIAPCSQGGLMHVARVWPGQTVQQDWASWKMTERRYA